MVQKLLFCPCGARVERAYLSRDFTSWGGGGGVGKRLGKAFLQHSAEEAN